MNFHPPVHPQPGFYETTEVEGITHVEVEQIAARPKWDFEEANLRLFKEKKAREAQAKDRTKKKPTPKQRTPKPPQQETS